MGSLTLPIMGGVAGCCEETGGGLRREKGEGIGDWGEDFGCCRFGWFGVVLGNQGMLDV